MPVHKEKNDGQVITLSKSSWIEKLIIRILFQGTSWDKRLKAYSVLPHGSRCCSIYASRISPGICSHNTALKYGYFSLKNREARNVMLRPSSPEDSVSYFHSCGSYVQLKIKQEICEETGNRIEVRGSPFLNWANHPKIRQNSSRRGQQC